MSMLCIGFCWPDPSFIFGIFIKHSNQQWYNLEYCWHQYKMQYTSTFLHCLIPLLQQVVDLFWTVQCLQCPVEYSVDCLLVCLGSLPLMGIEHLAVLSWDLSDTVNRFSVIFSVLEKFIFYNCSLSLVSFGCIIVCSATSCCSNFFSLF